MDPKLKDTSYIKIFRSLDLLTSFLLPIRKPVHRYVVCVKLVVELLLGSWEKEGTARFAETIFYYLWSQIEAKYTANILIRYLTFLMASVCKSLLASQVPCTFHITGQNTVASVLTQQLDLLKEK